MTSTIQIVTDSNFQQVVKNSDVPVLVDFWAPWCGPCRMVGPILEEVATEFEGRAKIVKINVDEEQVIAGQMGVRSIPTIALFKNGKVEDLIVGAKPKEEFTSILNKVLKNG